MHPEGLGDVVVGTAVQGEHLALLASALGFAQDLPSSQYQNLLLEAKRTGPATRTWSEPKFMAYLYRIYVRPHEAIKPAIETPPAKKHGRVDFEEMQKQKAEIGRAAEDFAL